MGRLARPLRLPYAFYSSQPVVCLVPAMPESGSGPHGVGRDVHRSRDRHVSTAPDYKARLCDWGTPVGSCFVPPVRCRCGGSLPDPRVP